MDAWVWVDSWQEQCCGDGFAVGASVNWKVVREVDGHEFIELAFGADRARRVQFHEEHHDDEVDGVLRGAVSQIDVVTCGRAAANLPGGPPGKVLVPVEGSGRLRSVDVADCWEPEPSAPTDEWSFDGWIVHLTDATFGPI